MIVVKLIAEADIFINTKSFAKRNLWKVPGADVKIESAAANFSNGEFYGFTKSSKQRWKISCVCMTHG